MKLMQKTTWNRMTPDEKLGYLHDHEITTQKKSLMNARAKTSDPMSRKVRPFYRAACGGVLLTQWMADKQECLQVAAEILADTIEQLNVQSQ